MKSDEVVFACQRWTPRLPSIPTAVSRKQSEDSNVARILMFGPQAYGKAQTIVLERGELPPTLADLWRAGPKPRAVAWVFDGQVLRDSAVRAAWPAGVAAVGVHGTANRDAEYAHARDPHPSCALRSEPRGWAHARAMNLAVQTADLTSIGVDAHTPRLAVGASLGGLAAMLCAVASPSHWRGVVGLSPSVGWAQWEDDIKRRWIEQVQNRCALYIDAGGTTAADDNRYALDSASRFV